MPIVPSIPARPERNFLINPAQPDARASCTPCPNRCGGTDGFTGGERQDPYASFESLRTMAEAVTGKSDRFGLTLSLLVGSPQYDKHTEQG